MCVQRAFLTTNSSGKSIQSYSRRNAGLRGAGVSPAIFLLPTRYENAGETPALHRVVFHFQLFRGGRRIAKASYVAYQVPNLAVG